MSNVQILVQRLTTNMLIVVKINSKVHFISLIG